MGWGFHYFPFYLMSRQLFLHHYFPALYFAILLLCAVFDILTANLKKKYRLQIAAALLAIAILNYAHFMPLTYGTPWTKGACQKSQWLKTWDFACTDFYDDYSKYSTVSGMSPTPPPRITIGGAQEGRAAVVVEDHGNKAEKEEIATSVVPNQPVPGPDVFEKAEGQHIQSADSPQPPQEQEHREVTNNDQHSVEKMVPPPPPPPQAQEGVAGGTVHEGEKNTAKDAKETSIQDTTEAQSTTAAEKESESSSEEVTTQPTMETEPKGDAEAERDRVMEELFGKEEN